MIKVIGNLFKKEEKKENKSKIGKRVYLKTPCVVFNEKERVNYISLSKNDLGAFWWGKIQNTKQTYTIKDYGYHLLSCEPLLIIGTRRFIYCVKESDVKEAKK